MYRMTLTLVALGLMNKGREMPHKKAKAILWIVCALLVSYPVYGESKSPRQPNFIFVLSDDIAQGDLGCYGQKLIKTPRLDQMAAEGTRYLQAYCGTSVCAPSRSSFFTGLHTGSNDGATKRNGFLPMQ